VTDAASTVALDRSPTVVVYTGSVYTMAAVKAAPLAVKELVAAKLAALVVIVALSVEVVPFRPVDAV
jgi:hypothetical protein